MQSSILAWTLGFQAVYYVVTGIWPFLSMKSFLAVTGPKTDLWLLRLVALLIIVIGLTVGLAVWSERITPEIVVCSVLSCLAFIGIDSVYALSGWISKVYLADAVVEALMVITIVFCLATRK